MPEEPANPEPKPQPFFDHEDPNPAPAANTTPPAPAAPEPVKHNPRSLRLAQEFGIDPSAYLPSELDAAVHETAIAVSRMQKQAWAETQHRQAMEPKPAPAVPEVPKVDPDDFPAEFDEQVHPLIAARMRKDAADKKEMKAKLDAMEQKDRTREHLSRVETIDAAFEALGETYVPLLGTGSGPEMDASSPEFKRRIAILTSCGLDLSKPQTARAITAAIKAAAETLYGTVVKPATSAAPADPYAAAMNGTAAPVKKVPPKDAATGRFTKEEWEAGALSRTTDRTPPKEPKGTKLAEKSVAELLAKNMGFQDDGESGHAQVGDFLGGQAPN